MTTLTLQPPATATTPSQGTLATAMAAAADAVVALPLDDPRWAAVGPRLTAFVAAVRQAIDATGSPIGPSDTVSPVLRMRDLARVAEMTASATGPVAQAPSAAIMERLRSLEIAVLGYAGAV